MTDRPARIFYGWWNVATGFVGMGFEFRGQSKITTDPAINPDNGDFTLTPPICDFTLTPEFQ